MFVEVSVSVTDAPGTTAPVASVTRPVTLEDPLEVCPKSNAVDSKILSRKHVSLLCTVVSP
jgi:hypothetical protein